MLQLCVMHVPKNPASRASWESSHLRFAKPYMSKQVSAVLQASSQMQPWGLACKQNNLASMCCSVGLLQHQDGNVMAIRCASESQQFLQAFWRTVLAFPLDKRKRFLFFCTGCDR